MQLSDVKEACCEFLLNQLHPTNCLGIKSFADLHGCLELLAATNTYIESHFAEVLDCDEFQNLDHEQVSDLIASDTITVPSEEKVYERLNAVKLKPEDVCWFQRTQDTFSDFRSDKPSDTSSHQSPLNFEIYLISRLIH